MTDKKKLKARRVKKIMAELKKSILYGDEVSDETGNIASKLADRLDQN